LSHLPVRRELVPGGISETLESAAGDAPRRSFSWRTVVRNRWMILGCAAGAVALAAGLTYRAVPVYEGASTLRIEQKQSNLPESFRTMTMPESWLPTEMEELRSRALASDVVKEFGLCLSVIEPQVRRRSDLLRDIQVTDSARTSVYRLVALGGGAIALLDDSTGRRLAAFAQRERVVFGGFSFTLAARTLPPKGIRFAVRGQTAVAVRDRKSTRLNSSH